MDDIHGPLPTADEAAGMAWWNSLEEYDRAEWAAKVGTGVVADAWAARKLSLGKERVNSRGSGTPSPISIERAIALAAIAHEGQTDKAGQPYIFHVLRVMMGVVGYERQLAACGHDLVEDTDLTAEDLQAHGFPHAVVEAILVLTKRSGESREDAARRARLNPIARDVKIADNADNSDLSRIENPTDKDLKRSQEYAMVRKILRQG